MKTILSNLSRETLMAVIKENAAHQNPTIETIGDISEAAEVKELKTACYIFLSEYLIQDKSEAKMFKKILSADDIETLLQIQPYNYHKIKLTPHD